MRTLDLIKNKRDGKKLSKKEIEYLIDGFVKGDIPDYQMSAFLMAVFFSGMTASESMAMTLAMRDSGRIISLSSINGIKIDKHSTGGVGDKISLILAPLVASFGLKVPMMAGRGLGHTGGTIDKCESIPGYRTNLNEHEVRGALKEAGYAIFSQSDEVVPADKKMYALRDVTATVESIPLITASILSKKCAEGADGFVFDVKTGSGAFMKDMENAEALAKSLVDTCIKLGKKAICVITDMDQPLGFTVGNFLEIEEVVQCLKGKGPKDVVEVILKLASWMLKLGGLCKDAGKAEVLCKKKLEQGEGFRKFLENIKFQGGDPDFFKDQNIWPVAPVCIPLASNKAGYVKRIDAYKIGIASCLLGAGREKKDDTLNPLAGIRIKKIQGDKVYKGDVLVLLYTAHKERLETVKSLVLSAFEIDKEQIYPKSRILKLIGSI